MTEATQRVPFGEIVAALRDLCAARSTGTLFIVTDDKRAVRVGLDNGEIIALVAGDRRDEAAIQALQGVKEGSYGFQEGRLLDPQAAGNPLDTEGLLASLAGERKVSRAAPPSQDDTLTQARVIVESEAVDLIGPIARVLCAEHCAAAQDLHSLKQALERIAGEIHDADQAAELRRRVMERLRTALPALV